jgi:hypothetical protein
MKLSISFAFLATASLLGLGAAQQQTTTTNTNNLRKGNNSKKGA